MDLTENFKKNDYICHVKGFGTILRESRKERGLTIKEVAQKNSIDTGLLSKIERGERLATRQQLDKFLSYFNLDAAATTVIWLSDKVFHELKDEPYAKEAIMMVNEEMASYQPSSTKISFDDEVLQLLLKVDELKAKWQEKKPLVGIQLEKMREHFDLNYTFESNKIEGNTLTLQETYLVVKEGLTIGGKTMNEHLEAINHSEAIDFIVNLVQKKELFSERVLKEIHYLILKEIDKSNAGRYRTVPVMISGSVHNPPQPYLVEKRMEEVFEFYNENYLSLHPVVLAAEMHERIVTIHPFIDGNGRTSRLVMNLILLMNGYTLAILKGDNRSRIEYYNALENTRLNNDRSIFHKLILNTAIDSLDQHIGLT